MLRADGQYPVGSGGPWSWHLAWRGSEFVRNTFETLASRCAFEIAPPGTTDLIEVLISIPPGKSPPKSILMAARDPIFTWQYHLLT